MKRYFFSFAWSSAKEGKSGHGSSEMLVKRGEPFRSEDLAEICQTVAEEDFPPDTTIILLFWRELRP